MLAGSADQQHERGPDRFGRLHHHMPHPISARAHLPTADPVAVEHRIAQLGEQSRDSCLVRRPWVLARGVVAATPARHAVSPRPAAPADRKSTRLNSSHVKISYAVFCLKKKKKKNYYSHFKKKKTKKKKIIIQ